MDLETISVVYLLYKRRKERIGKKKKQRRWWVRPILQNRKQQGAYHNLVQEMRLNDNENFFNFYRMTPELYEELLNLIGPVISKQYCIREPISASERLSLTLRYLASGDSMKSIKFLYRISASSVSIIIKEVCDALWSKLIPTVLPPPETINWKNIADDFYRLWNFPNLCGSIDGKHINIQAPANTGSLYYNYKGFFSIILLAICDANYVFTCVDIGSPGRESDGGVFSRSLIGKKLENGSFGLPKDSPLPHEKEDIPYVIVGDEAFPLKKYLMRPYPGKFLNNEKTIFNYRLSRARRTIENAFGILVARMRILRKPIVASLSTATAITKATIVLHNFLQKSDIAKPPRARTYCPPSYADYEDEDGNLHEGHWRNEIAELQTISQQGSNRYSVNAANVRSNLTEYFMTTGSIPWQWNKI